MRLVLCDARRSYLEAVGGALARRGHQVLGSCQDPADLPGVLQEHRPDLSVVDATYAGVVRLDLVAAAALSTAAPLVVLTDLVSPALWRAHDDGLVRGLVSKMSSTAVLDVSLRAVHDGRSTVTGFVRPDEPGTIRSQRDDLSVHERTILDLVTQGQSTRSVATVLGVSVGSARVLVATLLDKMVRGDGAQPHRGTARTKESEDSP